jgi:hypothetical protein
LSSERREVSQEETLTGLLNTLQAQQSVLEQEVARGHLHPFKERKGQRHFEVRATDKLRRDSTISCKGLQEVAEFEGTFEVQRNKSQEEERLLEYRWEPRLQASQQRQRPRPFGARNLPRERKKGMLKVEHSCR